MLCFTLNSHLQAGEYCVSGSYDKTVRLWNPHKGSLIKNYRGHGYQVVGVAIHEDNSQIASCGGDRSPYLWDVATGQIIRKFKGHAQKINCIAWNKECTVLVTGSFDTSVKLWDAKSRSYDPIQILEDAKDSVESLCMGTYEIITGSTDGCVRVYDIRMGEIRTDKVGQPVSSVGLSGDEAILLVSTLDSTIRLIDKQDGTLYHTLKGHKNDGYPVRSTFSNTDAFVISGDEDGKTYWWSVEKGTLLHSSKVHADRVSCVDYHPNKQALLTCSADKTIKLFQPKDANKPEQTSS